MPRALVHVTKIDQWPTQKPGVTLFLIKGETIDERPQYVTLKTCSEWRASLCEQAMKAGRYVFAEWVGAGAWGGDLQTVKLDTSKWNPDDVEGVAHV